VFTSGISLDLAAIREEVNNKPELKELVRILSFVSLKNQVNYQNYSSLLTSPVLKIACCLLKSNSPADLHQEVDALFTLSKKIASQESSNEIESLSSELSALSD